MSDTYQAMLEAATSALFSLPCAIARVELELIRPSVLHRPYLSRDGNQWLALYGENIQEGVCAFGDSPQEAMYNFDLEWIKKISKETP